MVHGFEENIDVVLTAVDARDLNFNHFTNVEKFHCLANRERLGRKIYYEQNCFSISFHKKYVW